MGYLAIFIVARSVVYEVELSPTFRNGLEELATPLHSVSPLQQPVARYFTAF